MRNESVRIVAIDTSLRLIGATEDDRAALLRFVPWVEAVGVPWLRVFDGGDTASPGEMTEMSATLQWWRNTRAKAGWRVDVMG